jgi:hypothetical protein
MGGPTPRDAVGLGRETNTRLDLLEGRFARPLPARLRTQGEVVEDWHDIRSVGFYHGLSAANAPTTGDVMGIAESDGTNIVVTAHSAADPSKRWFAVWNGTTWSAWTRIAPSHTSGSIAVAAVVADASAVSYAVTFPVGLFTVAPDVHAIPANSRLNLSITARSASGVTFAVTNWSPANSPATTVYWDAVGV